MHNTKERDLRTEPAITKEHVVNNTEVRKVMGVRGIKPEHLPSAGDVKKVERRLAADARKLPRVVKAIGRRGRKKAPK